MTAEGQPSTSPVKPSQVKQTGVKPTEVKSTQISGTTRLAAVIGDPVRHSLSPAIHNAAFAATGLDWRFVAFEVPEGRAPKAIDAMRSLGLGGLSVTMPHKAAVAAAVDSCSPAAALLGAVNCVVPTRHGLRGENTDGVGFLRGLYDDARLDVAGLRCVVLGAGGAARAVIVALAGAGAGEVVVVNRSPDAARVAMALAGECGRIGSVADVARADLVVNATPMGMTGRHQGSLALDPDELHIGQVVADLVYEPADSALVLAAQARGVSAYNGLSMLVHQAAVAFELWTGTDAPVSAMRAGVLEALEDRRQAAAEGSSAESPKDR
jgi:shikimate dehydrogenase